MRTILIVILLSGCTGVNPYIKYGDEPHYQSPRQIYFSNPKPEYNPIGVCVA